MWEGAGQRTWTGHELAAGFWLSLGHDGSECTRRKFIMFDHNKRVSLNHTVRFPGPVTFDTVVCSKLPAGGPVDLIRNHEPLIIPDGHSAEVTLHWQSLWR